MKRGSQASDTSASTFGAEEMNSSSSTDHLVYGAHLSSEKEAESTYYAAFLALPTVKWYVSALAKHYNCVRLLLNTQMHILVTPRTLMGRQWFLKVFHWMYNNK